MSELLRKLLNFLHEEMQKETLAKQRAPTQKSARFSEGALTAYSQVLSLIEDHLK